MMFPPRPNAQRTRPTPTRTRTRRIPPMQGRRWVLAVVLYSLAVSVKMNVLLMAPGVLAVLIKVRGWEWEWEGVGVQ